MLEQYREQGARALVTKARLAAAQLLIPPRQATTGPPPVIIHKASGPHQQDEWPQDALAIMCAGVAMRDLNLVDSLLAQLEDMEANEGDPDALARLYRLDHLATRLRRNAENLRVLAGHDAGIAAHQPAPLIDVVRAAMSAIEQYTRIEIGRVAALAVVDFAADDLSRLLAELLDNATTQSPPTSQVTVSAHLTEQGSVLLRVEDAGIGLPADRLKALNRRLSTAPRLDSEAIEHMGLAVVRRLASKHRIRVMLDQRSTHGTVASVLLPATLVCELPPTPWFTDKSTITFPRPPFPLPQATPARYHPGIGSGPARPAPAEDNPPAVPAPSPRPSVESAQPAMTSVSFHTPLPRTTRSGLPRRVPQSLRDFAASSSATTRSPDDGESDASEFDLEATREHLMADLDAFSDGEQAAREARNSEPEQPADPAEGPTDDH